MTVLETIKNINKTEAPDEIMLSQWELFKLNAELCVIYDAYALMQINVIDQVNYMLKMNGLPKVKLNKMDTESLKFTPEETGKNAKNYKVKYTIDVPEGMEVDQVTFRPVHKLTYNDVCKEIFRDRMNYIESIGTIAGSKSTGSEKYNPNNATTSKQLEKLLAFNKLMNVAVYLNPNKESASWSITLNDAGGVDCGIWINVGQPCFIDRDTCMKAVEILGKTTIKVALGRL